jgi:hypothetical protein
MADITEEAVERYEDLGLAGECGILIERGLTKSYVQWSEEA